MAWLGFVKNHSGMYCMLYQLTNNAYLSRNIWSWNWKEAKINAFISPRPAHHSRELAFKKIVMQSSWIENVISNEWINSMPDFFFFFFLFLFQKIRCPNHSSWLNYISVMETVHHFSSTIRKSEFSNGRFGIVGMYASSDQVLTAGWSIASIVKTLLSQNAKWFGMWPYACNNLATFE